MKIENGKIIEANTDELFRLYLDRGYEDAIDFYEYCNRMQECGCKIVK